MSPLVKLALCRSLALLADLRPGDHGSAVGIGRPLSFPGRFVQCEPRIDECPLCVEETIKACLVVITAAVLGVLNLAFGNRTPSVIELALI